MSPLDVGLQAIPWERRPTPAAMEVAAPGTKAFYAHVRDGLLTCYVSLEPQGWHLSISHRVAAEDGTGLVPGRLPTWDEIKDARYRFVPDRARMAMILPPRAEFVNVHPTTMHLFETPADER